MPRLSGPDDPPPPPPDSAPDCGDCPEPGDDSDWEDA